MKTSTSSRNKIFRRFAAVAVWLLVWQTVSSAVNKELLIASPVQVGLRLFEMIKTPSFWLTALRSLLKITEGYLLGVLCGTLLSVLTAAFRFCYDLFYPLISTVRATPVASFIILALVWLKRDNISVFICFLMVMPIVWANVTQGIVSTDKKLIEMARVYSFSKYKLFRLVYVPSVMPSFATGATTALGLAWKAGIAAEVLSTPQGYIGTQLYNSKVYLETADLFAWTIVVIALSFILERLVVKLLEKLLKGEWTHDKA